MRKINEVLRLRFELERSHRQIARSIGTASSTVADYLRRFAEAGLSWPLSATLSEATPEQFDAVLSPVRRARAQALYVIDDPFFDRHRATIARLALKAQLPTSFGQREYVDEGGLMSYGASYADLFRRSAGYVDRILKGMKAGDLPIEQPTKFEFVINLKTAEAIRLTIPQSVLTSRQ